MYLIKGEKGFLPNNKKRPGSITVYWAREKESKTVWRGGSKLSRYRHMFSIPEDDSGHCPRWSLEGGPRSRSRCRLSVRSSPPILYWKDPRGGLGRRIHPPTLYRSFIKEAEPDTWCPLLPSSSHLRLLRHDFPPCYTDRYTGILFQDVLGKTDSLLGQFYLKDIALTLFLITGTIYTNYTIAAPFHKDFFFFWNTIDFYFYFERLFILGGL